MLDAFRPSRSKSLADLPLDISVSFISFLDIYLFMTLLVRCRGLEPGCRVMMLYSVTLTGLEAGASVSETSLDLISRSCSTSSSVVTVAV